MRLVLHITHASRAFDIIEGNPIASHRDANHVYIQYQDSREEACLGTYHRFNTLRHKINISQNIIDRYHLVTNREYDVEFEVLADGSHLYTIL